MPEKPAIGKIGGGMFILFLIILFIAAHGGSNEMMYITLIFVFVAIMLFSYGFWSAVSKGEGIWQYTGKHNLQHQQISNPNYHFGGSMRNRDYRSHPQKNVHLCAPPKMGGARLNIYTIPLDQSPTTPTSGHNPSTSPQRKFSLYRNPSNGSTHRQSIERSAQTNRSKRSRVRSSFRRKPETTEEQIKVEVYSEAQNSRQTDGDFKEIHIPIPQPQPTDNSI